MNGNVEIPPAGRDYLGADVPPVPRTTDEVLAIWRRARRAGERNMLDVLVECYPKVLSRMELGELSGSE